MEGNYATSIVYHVPIVYSLFLVDKYPLLLSVRRASENGREGRNSTNVPLTTLNPTVTPFSRSICVLCSCFLFKQPCTMKMRFPLLLLYFFQKNEPKSNHPPTERIVSRFNTYGFIVSMETVIYQHLFQYSSGEWDFCNNVLISHILYHTES